MCTQQVRNPLQKHQALLHMDMAGTGHCLLPIFSWKQAPLQQTIYFLVLHTKLLAPGLQDSLQDDTAPGGSELRVSSKEPEGAVEHMDKQENWETHWMDAQTDRNGRESQSQF